MAKVYEVKKTKNATDKEKKEIIAHYAKCQNYSETARAFGKSPNTIKYIIKHNEELAKICEEKVIQNTEKMVNLFKRDFKKVMTIKKRYLDEALNEKKIAVTGLRDLFTAYGIIIDKEFKLMEIELQREKLELEKEKLALEKKKFEEGIADMPLQIMVQRKEDDKDDKDDKGS